MHLQRAYRIVTYIPVGVNHSSVTEFVRVLNAKFDIAYGEYRDVAWYSVGTERFRPLENARPAHGEIGQLVEVESHRVEFSVPFDAALVTRIVDELHKLHPWEEPVIQIYEIQETRR